MVRRARRPDAVFVRTASHAAAHVTPLLHAFARSWMRCPACRLRPAGETALCSVCRRELAAAVAGLPATAGDVVHLGPHAGRWRSLVHALKFRGARRLAEPLGALLAARLRRCGWLPDVVTHLPTDPGRRASRGYDQAEALARAVASAAGLPYRTLLTRTRSAPRQAGLGRAARTANVRGAFRVTPLGSSSALGRVLIVDDVLTTGASLEACRRVLTSAGAVEVRFAVVALTAATTNDDVTSWATTARDAP